MGVVPYFVYKGVKKFGTGKGVSNLGLILAGISGALVNTLLVMNMIFLFFREAYAAANEVAVQAVYGFILSVYRDQRGSGSHCGRNPDLLYRPCADEKKYQGKIRFYL